MCTEIICHPSNWVSIDNQSITTTSLKVAQAFNKRHKDVLRKLEVLDCSSDFTERNFALSEYQDATGRKLPYWEMTKDGFLFLVMGFTGKKAARIKEAYINAFNQMTEQLTGPQGKLALPAKIEPRSVFDLDYTRDLRHDDTQYRNIEWWAFDRPGGEDNWAGDDAYEQGRHFFRQTQRLAAHCPEDAEHAMTWSLMNIIGGVAQGDGHYGCEFTFCQNVSRAAVAWMISAGKDAIPPENKPPRRRHRRK
ncbi:MAG: Rha family transcriptional regulator [Candidatus Thiodiazotropha sp.]